MSAIEVIVVANGCKDGTREYVESLGEPFKLIWFDDPIGYARANNAGIRASKYDYVILLNNDAQILPFMERHAWVNLLLDPFKADDKMAVTGALKTYQEMLQHEFLIFCCVMIKKSLFDELGYLDEKFGEGGGEDTDFCMKAVRAGYKQLQVPSNEISNLRNDDGLIVTNFPIYHPAGVTCTALSNWDEVINRNNKLLEDRWVKHLDV
jgi:GT2 family glycosyltransferase